MPGLLKSGPCPSRFTRNAGELAATTLINAGEATLGMPAKKASAKPGTRAAKAKPSQPAQRAVTRGKKSAKKPVAKPAKGVAKVAKPAQAKRATSAKPAKPAKAVARKPAPRKSAMPAQAAAAPVLDVAEIDARLADTRDWRNGILAQVRGLIRSADPDVVERIQWRKPGNGMLGVPTWSHDGLICTGETYKDKVKFTFARGAALPDPAGLFNGADNGATRRSIDLREGQMVHPEAFKQLVWAAIEENAR